MPNRPRAALFLGIAIGSIALTARAGDKDSPGWLLPLPEVEADVKVPTLKQQIGHGWGEEISSHAEIERYLRALTSAAPDRTRLVQYGQTIEKRGALLSGHHQPQEPLAPRRYPRDKPPPCRSPQDHA